MLTKVPRRRFVHGGFGMVMPSGNLGHRKSRAPWSPRGVSALSALPQASPNREWESYQVAGTGRTMLLIEEILNVLHAGMWTFCSFTL